MATNKILYVCQEISPYLPETPFSKLSLDTARQMQERGIEVRTFMPRYGCINERRNQLHEVIRLSGMNIIINDNDHQLIIKVATIPAARMQIYFIDNDDYFARRAVLHDEEGRFFEDNDDRAIFFARGTLETVKKFVLSLSDDKFEGQLADEFKHKLEEEGIMDSAMKVLEVPSYENLYRFVMEYADGIVVTSPNADKAVLEYAKSQGKKVLEYQECDEKEYFDNYKKFYEEL